MTHDPFRDSTDDQFVVDRHPSGPYGPVHGSVYLFTYHFFTRYDSTLQLFIKVCPITVSEAIFLGL